MATNIDKFIEPSEIPASTGMPVGGIIAWQNPNPAAPNPSPPAGFEFCDGGLVSTPGPMNGQTKANLMVTSAGGTKGIIRGADITANYGDGTALVAGGADTHAHSGGTTADGNHSHNVNSHNHTISADGNHSHTLPVASGFITFNPGMPVGRSATTTSDGSHSHTGVTSSTSPGTDSQGNHSHSFNTNSASTLPRFIELAHIVRVLA